MSDGPDTVAAAALANLAGGSDTPVGGVGNDLIQGDAATSISEALSGAGGASDTTPVENVVDFRGFVAAQVEAAFKANPSPTPLPPVSVAPTIPYVVSIATPGGKRVLLAFDSQGSVSNTDLDGAKALQAAALAVDPTTQAAIEVLDDDAKVEYGLT